MTTTQRVMITAGAAGIGWAIAKAFADQGAQVHICDIDQNALDEVTDAYPEIIGTRVDVSDPDEMDDWFDVALDDLGGLDVLVNNAGIAGPTAAVEDMDYEDWRQCVTVCLDSQFLAARRALPIMKQQRDGSIINISSGAGLFGYPFRTPYASAKWAIIGFTKSLAAEAGPFNIRVNAICPGAVAGPRMDRVIAAEARATGRSEADIRTDYTKSVSLRRFVEPEEIADAALFLASPAAKMISGEALAVDGHAETYHSE
jgi:NAD(P)-dependent dehydrogenase (short-subunit alcohol dehydrogenase family)